MAENIIIVLPNYAVRNSVVYHRIALLLLLL